VTLSTTDGSTVARAFLAALEPPPQVSVSEWSDRYRVLSSSQSSEPGRWQTAKVPYMREIMDAFSPTHPAQEIVFQKCARIAGTEAGINNVVGAYMHQWPCPIMVAQPSEGDAEEWSKDSLDPMIDGTPELRRLVTADSARKKGNTILHKRYMGGVLYAVGASTAKSFRRRTARVALGDEIDGWPGALAGEGDPVKLMANRTKTFTWNKKIGLMSTPTVKDASRIEASFLRSDMRYYHVPCPDCGKLQRLVWSQMHWAEGAGPESAEYECVECGVLIPHHRKAWMLAEENGARWIPTHPERAIVGYQISALYSPWVTWGQLAREWVEAQGDPLQEQVFVNTALGETWDVAQGEAWDEDGLMRLVEPLERLPERAVILTAGTDVQDDRLVVQIDAWARDGERWTLERRDLAGDPAQDEVWTELEAVLLQRWTRTDGVVLGVRAACIDYGGHHSERVASFCRRNRRRRWWAIVGRGGPGKRVWPGKPTRKNKGRVDLYVVGVDGAKELLMSRLKMSVDALARNERGGPGFWHFAEGEWCGRSYFAELTAEVAVVEYPKSKRGAHKVAVQRRWILRPGRSRNEALDCSVYSYAALQGLTAAGAVVEATPLPSPSSPPSPPTPLPDPGVSDHRPDRTRRAETPQRPSAPPPKPTARPPEPEPRPQRKLAKSYMRG